MANAREIQSRMNSIKSTMKITNAMYTISSSKLKKARKNLTDTEPYFYALQRTISRIVRHTPEIEDPYFDTRPQIKPEDKKIGYIVVTADKAGPAVFCETGDSGRTGFPVYGAKPEYEPGEDH